MSDLLAVKKYIVQILLHKKEFTLPIVNISEFHTKFQKLAGCPFPKPETFKGCRTELDSFNELKDVCRIINGEDSQFYLSLPEGSLESNKALNKYFKKHLGISITKLAKDFFSEPDESIVQCPTTSLTAPLIPPPKHDHPVKAYVDSIENEATSANRAGLPTTIRTKEQLNKAVCILADNLAYRGELVTVFRLERELFDRYHVQKWSDFNILSVSRVSMPRAVPRLFEIDRMTKRINLFISYFTQTTSLCTIHELDEIIADFEESCDGTFAGLKLGPIYKQAAIFEHFKFPPDGSAEILEITSLDIMKHFNSYRKKCRSSNSKLATNEFLMHLTSIYKVDSPWSLGVKINSVPLLLTIWSRSLTEASKIKKGIQKMTINELEEDVKRELDAIRLKILEETSVVNNLKLRKRLAKMEAGEVLQKFIKSYEALFECTPLNKKDCISQWWKNMNAIVKLVKASKHASYMIHLSLLLSDCNDSDEIIEALIQLIDDFRLIDRIMEMHGQQTNKHVVHIVDSDVNQYQSAIDSEISYDQLSLSDSSSAHSDQDRVEFSVDEIKSELLKLFNEALENADSITFHHLLSIEKALIKKFSKTSFEELQFGSFLEFVLSDGTFSSLLLKLSNANSSTVSKSDLSLFVSQCDSDDFQMKHIALRSYFSVDCDLEKLPQPDRRSIIVYEKAVCCSVDVGTVIDKQKLVGRAISLMKNSPFMTDIGGVLQWNKTFAPHLGGLSSFIKNNRSHPSFQDFVLLEVATEQWLKVRKDCSVSDFRKSCISSDAQKAVGAFSSLIISHGGASKAPMQLLKSELRSTLHILGATPETRISGPMEFCLECILCLPSKLACLFASKLALPVLNELFGDAAVRLASTATQDWQKSQLSSIGMSIGVSCWSDLFGVQVESDKDSSDINIANPIVFSTPTREERKSKESEKQVSSVKRRSLDISISALDSKRCFEVVDDVLKTEFGEGLDLSPAAASLLEKHQRRIGRSLERLSKELYSTDVHFILELIQNADDNTYCEEILNGDIDGGPALVFYITENFLRVINNEVGFMEENIRALCDIGKTTKGKHRKGFIGQKGIGFKSVFKVSDAPEIYSNGFCIEFDVAIGSLGMIKPKWITDANRIDLAIGDFGISPTTNIILPFSSKSKMESIKIKLGEIKPTLLLFLNKLRHITFIDSINSTKIVISKSIQENGLVRLTHPEGDQLWLLHNTELDIPQHLGLPVAVTDVTLAFPVVCAEDGSYMFLTEQRFPAFAFLPLRQFGLNFIVQADFEIPSSRQDIDQDSPFNEWIASKLANLFMEALESFRRILSDNTEAAIFALLGYVPLPNDCMGFFRPVANRLLNKLRVSPIIPSITKGLVIPSLVLRCPDIIDDQMLFDSLGFYRAPKALDTMVRPALLREIGVRNIELSDYISMLRYYCSESSTCSKNISIILYCIYNDHAHELSETHKFSIKSLHCLPLIGKSELASIDSCSPKCIFMIQEGIKLPALPGLLLIDKIRLGLPSNVSDNHNVVNTALLSLGVKMATMQELVSHHVLPLLESSQSYDLDESQLIDCTTFLKDQLAIRPSLCSIEKLREILPIRATLQGEVRTIKAKDSYFYYRDCELVMKFPSISWLCLSNCYKIDADWRGFFDRLGACKSWHFEKNPETFDYACKELAEILNKEDISLFDSYKYLLNSLSSQWTTLRSFLCSNDTTPTSVGKLLKAKKWIPCSDNKIYQPSDVFLGLPINQVLLGKFAPLLQMDIVSGFCDFLGITRQCTGHRLLEVVSRWAQDEDFESTTDHFSAVYCHLSHTIHFEELASYFEKTNLLYVGHLHGFVSINDVVVDDPHGLYKTFSNVLSCRRSTAPKIFILSQIEQYQALKKFFLSIGIRPQPNYQDYQNLLHFLTASINMAAEDHIKDFFRLVELSKIDEDIKWPTHDNRMTAAPMIPDDKNLLNMAKNKNGLDILHPMYTCIKPECIKHLPLISEEFATKVDVGASWSASVAHKFTFFSLPLIQLYVKRNFHEFYSKNSEVIYKKFQDLVFFTCEKLGVIRWHKKQMRIFVSRNHTVYTDSDSNRFYLHRKSSEEPVVIGHELVSLISCSELKVEESIELFLHALIPYFQSTKDLSTFRCMFKLGSLNGEEKTWNVSEPSYSAETIAHEQLLLKSYQEHGDVYKTTTNTQRDNARQRTCIPWPPLRNQSPNHTRHRSMSDNHHERIQHQENDFIHQGHRSKHRNYTVSDLKMPTPPKRLQQWEDDVLHQAKQARMNVEADSRIMPVSNSTYVSSSILRPFDSEINVASSFARQEEADTRPRNSLCDIRSKATTQKEANSNSGVASATLNLHLSKESAVSSSSLEPTISNLSTHLDPRTIVSSENPIVKLKNIRVHLHELDFESIKEKVWPNRMESATDPSQPTLAHGRWGEELVKNILCSSSSLDQKVDWVNEKKETGLPYDIVVRDLANNPLKFIEVRSTTQSSKEIFSLSWEEFEFIQSCQYNFYIYIVNNSGKKDARVHYFDRVLSRFRKRQLRLFFRI